VARKVIDIAVVRKLKREGAKIYRKRSKDPHKRILKLSLKTLVKCLLPVAVREFKKNPNSRTVYATTNIIAEVRNLINQIESSIDASSISIAVSQSVSSSLRRALSRMMSHIVSAKKSLPLKIENTANRRSTELILDRILKSFEIVMGDTILDIEERVASSVQQVLRDSKGVSTSKRGFKK